MGDAFDLLTAKGPIKDDILKHIFSQVVSAVSYVHSKGLAHQDIKLENILFDEHMNVKLADFGYATRQISTFIKLGSQGHMAPELYTNEEHDAQKADVFALGVVLFTLKTGVAPFKSAEITDEFYGQMYSRTSKLGFWKMHN